MKKQLLNLLALLGIGLGSFAQTAIPNGGFENWTAVGTSTERPTDWNSNKNGGGLAILGPQTCFRDSNAYVGAYCVKVLTGSTFGQTVNGSCATGIIEAPNSMASQGYIVDSGINAFTGRPDSIVFWYKYTQVGTDYPNVQARLHIGTAYNPETPVSGNHPDSTANIIARAQWTGAAITQATWARVSVPMVYADGRTPEYILITMTSSANLSAPAAGSTLWVDDMQAIYNTSGEKEITAEPIKVYLNGDKLMTDLTNESLNAVYIQVMNMEGQLVLDAPLKSNTLNETDASSLPAGVYLYQISSDKRNVIGKVGKQ
jgi:hypothetical protein